MERKGISQMKELIKQELYSSAIILGTFFVQNESHHRELLLLLADALAGDEQWSRAVHYYKQYIGETKSVRKSEQEMHTTKLKIGHCLLKLGRDKTAMNTFAAVSPQFHTPKTSVQLAKLYEKYDKKTSAIVWYERVLEANPLAIEASIALLRLGHPVDSVKETKGSTVGFVGKLVEAHAYSSKSQNKLALRSFGELKTIYPDSPHLLAQVAFAESQLYDGQVAIKTLEYMRQIDPEALEGMDLLAWLYRKSVRTSELTALARQVLVQSTTRPEPWLVAAYYADQTGQGDKARTYVEKALAIDSTHPGAHICKGFLLVAEQPHRAAKHYRAALERRKGDITAYQGLVECYLSPTPVQFKPALLTAKDALQVMPRNPKALTLVGLVLSHSPEGLPKARKALNKAIQVDPTCIDAVIALAKLFCQEGKYNDAIAKLTQYCRTHASDLLHTKLANVYAMNDMPDLALEHYQDALNLTPNYTPALTGLDRLSQAMREDEQSMSMDASYDADHDDSVDGIPAYNIPAAVSPPDGY